MIRGTSFTAACLAIGFVGFYAMAGERPAVEGLVTVNRAPLVITVGGTSADLPAFTSEAIQLAVDAAATRGGGTVRLGPGTFAVSGPIRLASNITLDGAGPETILMKGDGVRTGFVVDADYGMIKITVADSAGLGVGTGIQLYDDLHNGGWDVTTAVITAVDGNVLFIDNPTCNDYIAEQNGVVSSAFPIISAVDVENVRIANLVVDGNRTKNDYINGCVGGGVYIHRSRNCQISGVHVRNFNGDSFSWQITENITVRNCEASNGGGLGFHPGTGSDNTLMENNVSHHNDQDGIFLCWRVQHSTFRGNQSYGNKRYGISIGHKDTDNLFEDNRVYENGRDGVAFRDENEQNSGHRNTFVRNRVEDNGSAGEPAYGFNIGGLTRGVVLKDNVIRSSGKGNQQAAVFVGRQAGDVEMDGNQISGHPVIVREADGPGSSQ